MSHVDIVFDGPPGPTPGRFVEVENAVGRSISFGEWVHRDDGYWVLRIDAEGQLERLLRMQRELQVESFGSDPSELEDEARTTFILWNAYALTDEIHEMTDEVGWKPWASSRHVNADEALGELIDALHFLLNLFWAVEGGGMLGDAGALSDVIVQRYEAKRARNADRQADGYDGVSGKCPGCKRDLTDVEPIEVEDPHHGTTVLACGGCGKVLDGTPT